jgi:hypothetical protein
MVLERHRRDFEGVGYGPETLPAAWSALRQARGEFLVLSAERAGGRPGRGLRCSGGWAGRAVTRVMFHDHELVLDHGTAGACSPA